MRNLLKIFTVIITGTFWMSCTDDLEVSPKDPDEIVAIDLYNDPEAYKQVLAKLYGGLSLTGQQGPAGMGDLAGIDEGFSQYVRMYWYLQELTTDEAVVAWNDPGIRDLHNQNWDASNNFVGGMYARIFFQITLANEFIRASSGVNLDEVPTYNAEARFLRALSYWHALDLFGSVPFTTEADGVGAFFPSQISKSELFNYIESELLDVEDLLVGPGQNEYGRVDQVAAWMLLAKLYLNAETYLGEGKTKYTECLTYCNKVIGSTYSLENNFQKNFMADNDQVNEIIFPVAYDGLNTQAYGGTTFVIKASIGGSMNAADYGVDGGWGGTRTTSAYVSKFTDPSGATDSRALFYTNGQSLEIDNMGSFVEGYAFPKFTNVTSTGNTGSSLEFLDTDFPLFRLADAYLMYAEAVLRGGTGGDATTALSLVNDLRERAYGDTSGNIGASQLTLDFILDERARELAWEGHRRTDLIRYNRFTNSDYMWPWKGGVKDGKVVSNNYRLFPIPSSDLVANPDLKQNPGY